MTVVCHSLDQRMRSSSNVAAAVTAAAVVVVVFAMRTAVRPLRFKKQLKMEVRDRKAIKPDDKREAPPGNDNR